MPPIDTTTGEPWSPDSSQRYFQHMRTEVIAQLRVRDAQRGIPEDGKVYRMEGGHPAKDGSLIGARMVVDPILQKAKHSGNETNAILNKRWLDFCAKPRDETDLMASLLKEQRKEQLAAADAEMAKFDGVGDGTDDVPEHACMQCDRTFKNASNLGRHMQSHN